MFFIRRTVTGERAVEQMWLGLVGVWTASAHLAVQAKWPFQVAVRQPMPRTDSSPKRLGPQSRTRHSLHEQESFYPIVHCRFSWGSCSLLAEHCPRGFLDRGKHWSAGNSWFCVWNRASFSVNCIIFFVGDLKIFLFFSYTHMILFNQLRKQFLKHEFDHAKCNKMALSFYTKPDTPFKAYVKSQILKAVRPIRTM